jgi:hypothetical protein
MEYFFTLLVAEEECGLALPSSVAWYLSRERWAWPDCLSDEL